MFNAYGKPTKWTKDEEQLKGAELDYYQTKKIILKYEKNHENKNTNAKFRKALDTQFKNHLCYQYIPPQIPCGADLSFDEKIEMFLARDWQESTTYEGIVVPLFASYLKKELGIGFVHDSTANGRNKCIEILTYSGGFLVGISYKMIKAATYKEIEEICKKIRNPCNMKKKIIRQRVMGLCYQDAKKLIDLLAKKKDPYLVSKWSSIRPFVVRMEFGPLFSISAHYKGEEELLCRYEFLNGLADPGELVEVLKSWSYNGREFGEHPYKSLTYTFWYVSFSDFIKKLEAQRNNIWLRAI